MKNQTVTVQKQGVSMPSVSLREALMLWLSSRNRVFSFLMEKDVTNRQALLFINFLLAFCAVVGGLFTSFWVAVVLVLWFVAAFRSLKKGGL